VFVAAQGNTSKIGGTLVVAVPVDIGLVVCSDKMLYNETTKASREDFVKIHKVNDRTLFVATHTTGFLNRATGKMEFDIFDLTQAFVTKHAFRPDREYWNSLRNEIRNNLSAYLSKQRYADLPATDVSNDRLLFNLVFFGIDAGVAKSYSISVFYEKARTPVIDVADVVTESVRTPKLLGKGKDVMALFARDPLLASDPSILKFDQSYFNARHTSAKDAVTFASRLFTLANDRLSQARVSAVHDCALLDYRGTFTWIDDSSNFE